MTFSAACRALALLVTALAMAVPAHADIKAFNAAVRAGDYAAAAVEAEAVWKTWDIADEQTALIAREFGFAAYVAGRNELARQFGQFLVEKGATLPTPDTQPATSAVLFRAADFRLSSGDAQRKALREALLARSAASGVDMTSVLSWELLYVGDWNAADWEGVEMDAASAAEFFSRQSAGLLHRQRKAELTAASAMFLKGRNRVTKGKNDYYDKMADVHDAIVGDINAAVSQSDRNLLWPLKWQAEAWSMAMWSYLTSSYEQVGSNISTRVKERALARPMLAQFPEDPSLAGVPICDGEFVGKKLTYPSSNAFRGVVGAVVARMVTAPDGKVVNAEVLAAVPMENFGEKVADTQKTWTFKPAKGANVAGCRLNSLNHVYKVIFYIG